MNKSFFYRLMVLSIGALLAGIIACKNPAAPDTVKPNQNSQTPSGNGSGSGGTSNPGGQTPGGGGSSGGGGTVNPSNPVHPQTDQEKVEAAKATLELRANGKVGNRINLPRRGAHEVEISWSASPSGIIETEGSNSGSVNRPEEDTEVTLTATLKKGSATATKPFTVTVYGKNQELVDQAVRNIGPQPPAFVMGNPASPLYLADSVRIHTGPNPHTDYIEIPIIWKAEPEGIIDVLTGTVMQHETEKKEVTLTATAKKGNSTATGTFKITVYPKNVEPPLTELLTHIMDTIPAETDKDIPLMRTVADGYDLSWESSNDEVLSPSYNKARVKRDFFDRKATLTATLEKIDTHETLQKDKEVTVKAQTKFDNCELAGNLLTIKNYEGVATAVYRVQINADAKTIAAAAEQVAVNGTLMTLDAVKQQRLAEIDFTFRYHRSLLSLCDKQTVTLQDVKDAKALIKPNAATLSDEGFFNWLFEGSVSYEDFAAMSAEEKTRLLKENYLNPIKARVYGPIPLDTPLEQALVQLKEQKIAEISACVENAQKQRTYTYRAFSNWLDTEAQYVTGIPWHQQDGGYRYDDYSSPDIQFVNLSLSKQGNGKYWVSISISSKAGESSVSDSYSGDYDGSGTITARTNDSKQITVTVTDKGSGKVDVTSTGEVSFTKELEFEGKSIPDDPLRN